MSYQFKWQGMLGDMEAGLRAAPPVVVPGDDQVDAAEDHREAGIAMAKAFVDQLGDGYEEVVVLIAGHANPDHVPTFGWAPDHMTVTIQAVPRGR